MLSKMPLDIFMAMTECLYTFEPRNHLVQEVIAVAWVVGIASYD